MHGEWARPPQALGAPRTCTPIATMPGRPPRSAFWPASLKTSPRAFFFFSGGAGEFLPLTVKAASDRLAMGSGAGRPLPRRRIFRQATGDPAVVKLTLLGELVAAVTRLLAGPLPRFCPSIRAPPDVWLLSRKESACCPLLHDMATHAEGGTGPFDEML